MSLLDVMNGIWAIEPAKMSEIRGIYETHLRGEKIDIAGVEARLGQPLQRKDVAYEVINGVAVLAIEGVLANKMNLVQRISGGASMQIIGREFQTALEDRAVNAIVLAIDSPGGTVQGIQELTEIIRSAKGIKPVYAFTDGMMASAAYWIGSAADKIFISSDMTVVGSIGVVTAHRDISGAEEKAGVKTTEIVAGRYKREASQYAPLTDDARATIQSQLDSIYKIFIDAVAEHRNVSAATVHEKMADGRIFQGRTAIDAGLVDGVSTLSKLVADINSGAVSASGQLSIGAGVAPQTIEASMDNEKTESVEITQALITERYPYIAQAFRDEGAEAERQRIKDVEAQVMPGHESLIEQLKFDGKTTGVEAAAHVLAAHKSTLNKVAEGFMASAPDPAPASAAPATDHGTKKPSGHQIGARAKQLIEAAALRGETLGVVEAAEQAEKELMQ